MTYKPLYFDNAASSFPKPPCVLHDTFRFLAHNTANAGRSGHFLSVEAAERLFEARQTAADFFHARPEQVVFTQNATHAVNTLLFGLLKPGDRVLISDREHNCVWRPLVALQSKGIRFTVVPTDDTPDELRFEKALTDDTKLIFCTHASNVTGRLFNIKQIGAMAHRHNIPFAADVSQTAGVVPIDMQKDNVDCLCTAGHKGLLGLQGAGVLIVRPSVCLTPLHYGGNGVRSLEEDMGTDLPERLEAGTVNLPAIVSLTSGIRYVSTHFDRIRRREAETLSVLINGLKQNERITLFEPDCDRVGVVSFAVNGLSSEEVTHRLSEHGVCARGGYHCAALTHKSLGTARDGTVRLSVGPFNTPLQAKQVCNIIEKL